MVENTRWKWMREGKSKEMFVTVHSTIISITNCLIPSAGIINCIHDRADSWS